MGSYYCYDLPGLADTTNRDSNTGGVIPMSIEAVPFKPYTGPIDTGSKRYQTAKAMMEEGKAARQDMFDMALREYIRDNGMSGAETDRTAVYTRYQLSVEKSQRLKGTWTLQQYEGCYNRAFYNLVKEANPDWKPGDKFDPAIFQGITREDVERHIVQSSDGRSLTLTSGNAIDIKA